tara:strand:- start:44 stop:514 length:471 start_codon:yes stop_codon:yes gene_type:complete
MKVAVFPGSFDPVTLGHLEIIQKSEKIFDQIIIAIGENDSKKSFFSTDKKIQMLEKIFNGNGKISIKKYNTLTVNFCKSNNAKFIIRGLRNTLDFENEKQLALMNEELEDSITTVFFTCSKKNDSISSSLVKEIIKKKGDFKKFIPNEIVSEIKNL